jgi:hypothetical protein
MKQIFLFQLRHRLRDFKFNFYKTNKTKSRIIILVNKMMMCIHSVEKKVIKLFSKKKKEKKNCDDAKDVLV